MVNVMELERQGHDPQQIWLSETKGIDTRPLQ